MSAPMRPVIDRIRDIRQRFTRGLHVIREFLGYYLGGLYRLTGERHIFLLAGGLSFTLFVCSIPLTLIVFSVVSSLLQRPEVLEELRGVIGSMIPYPEYAAEVEQLVFERITQFGGYQNLAGAVGAVGLLLAASTLFSSLRTILNAVFEFRTGMSLLMAKFRDLGMVGVVLIYFLLATTLLPILGVAGTIAGRFEALSFLQTGPFRDLLVGVSSFGVIFLAFFAIYKVIPSSPISRRVALLSALTASVLWYAARELFGIYIAHVATMKEVYGAYFFVVVVAFWIYYTAIVLIIGGLVGQLYRRRRESAQSTNKK